MWTLIITVVGYAGINCTPVYGFISKEAAETARQAHSDSFGGSTQVYYAIVNMGDTA